MILITNIANFNFVYSQTDEFNSGIKNISESQKIKKRGSVSGLSQPKEISIEKNYSSRTRNSSAESLKSLTILPQNQIPKKMLQSLNILLRRIQNLELNQVLILNYKQVIHQHKYNHH